MFPINRLMEKKILASVNRVVNILIELSYANENDKSSYYDEAVNLIQEIRPLLLRLVDGKEEYLGSLLRQLVTQKLPHPSVVTSFGSLQKDLNVIISLSFSGDCAETQNNNTSADYQEANPQSVQELEPEASTQPAAECSDQAPAEAETGIECDVPAPEDQVSPTAGFEPALDSQDFPGIAAVSISAPSDDETEHQPDSVAEEVIPQEKIAADKLHGIVNIIYANEVLIKDYLFRSLKFDYYLPEKKLAITTLPALQRKHLIHDVLIKKEGISLIEITPEDLEDTALLSRKLRRFS